MVSTLDELNSREEDTEKNSHLEAWWQSQVQDLVGSQTAM